MGSYSISNPLIKGVARREWIKTRARNEALDCNVYALAALKLLSPDLEQLAAAMPSTPEPDEPQPSPPKPAPQKQQAWIPKIDNWMSR